MIIQSKNVWYRDRFQPLQLKISDTGTIEAINAYDDALSEEDYSGRIMPGFISTHDHGALGSSANEATHEYLDSWSEFLIKEGVTAFYPTTSTLSKEGLLQALEVLGSYQGSKEGAQFLGINAEGPMFSQHPQARGAHMPENIFPATLDLLEEMVEASTHQIKIITIAPDIEGAMDVYDACVKQGIRIYMGHMNANTQQIRTAIDHGATGFTHLYNGMTSFHHRDVGPIGIGLLDDETYVEIIADGVHASEEAIELVYRAKNPKKIITITDAIFAKGLPSGEYHRADKGSYIRVDEEGRVFLESGRLAGSTNRLNNLVDYQINTLGLPAKHVIASVTENPARMMGLNKGLIKVGYDADLICVDKSFRVLDAFVMGKHVFDNVKEIV